MTYAILILISIGCLIGGALVQRLLDERDKRPKRPEEPEQLRESAKALATWLNEGKSKGLVDVTNVGSRPDPVSLITGGKELTIHSRDLKALDKWLSSAPFLNVLKGETLYPGERDRLESRFWIVLIWLAVVGSVSAVGIINEWSPHPENKLAICVWSGLLGGCIAAFRSCLDRRSNGFEDVYGNTSPEPTVRKERFGDGMIRWLFGRPILSASVGLLLYFALQGEVFPKALNEEILSSVGRLVFYSCLAGLLAKTLLDIFLELGKKIFHTD